MVFVQQRRHGVGIEPGPTSGIYLATYPVANGGPGVVRSVRGVGHSEPDLPAIAVPSLLDFQSTRHRGFFWPIPTIADLEPCADAGEILTIGLVIVRIKIDVVHESRWVS